MRFLLSLLLLAALVYGGWPYYEYYQLDQAVTGTDEQALQGRVDLDRVRTAHLNAEEKRLKRQLPGESPIAAMARDGARWLNQAGTQEVSLAWVRDCLRGGPAAPGQRPASLSERTDFAFFEGPTRFVARLGGLDEDPSFVVLSFQDWRWRVSAIYGCGG
jgi:hypothetical protein